MQINLPNFNDLPSYQQRVVIEYNELSEKLDKLDLFIVADTFQKVSEIDRSLLREQSEVMKRYRHILERRIANFI